MRQQNITSTKRKGRVPTIQTTFRIPLVLHRKLKVAAAQGDTTVNAIVTQAIEARLERAA